MNSREWLNEIAEGRVPDDPRQKEQLAALRRLGWVQEDAGDYRLTAKGEELRKSWAGVWGGGFRAR